MSHQSDWIYYKQPIKFLFFLIGRETINIPEIFSGVHGFTGKTVNLVELLDSSVTGA